MQCTKPFYLKSENLWIPCGKCASCRVSRSREWTLRLLHEYGYHESTAFITLTYDDENLPLDQSISKNALQQVMRKLRDAKDGKVKYYACGEYGEEKGRPHYHAIMFGIGSKDTELIKNAWNKGRISNDTVTQHSIRYVTDYIHKENWIELYDYRKPPFSLKSQGLGKQWAIDNQEYLKQNIGTTLNGQECGIPKYYLKILDLDKELLIEKAKQKFSEEDQARYEDMLRYINTSKNNSTIGLKNLQRYQDNLNLITRNQIKKKGTM